MLHVSQPDLSGNEEAYALEAIRSTWISSSGAFVDRFEREFSEFCQTKTAVSVCNGTAALHLALAALDVGPEDEVVVPALTFVATANAVLYVGAKPVFVDVDPKTWCLDPAKFEAAITSRTRAVIPVHLYGHPADMDPIVQIATENSIVVIEDAAQAHGARYKGRPVGSLGDLGTFSFYGNKIISCGEGGAVVDPSGTADPMLRLLRGQGMDPKRRYYHSVVGYNYRLTNVACAILCAQLERAEAMLGDRAMICGQYRRGLPSHCLVQGVQPWAQPASWIMCVVFESVDQRHRVQIALADAKIETRPFFIPMHRLPHYLDLLGPQSLPVSERLAERGLCLPTYPGLSADEVDRVLETIRSV